MNFRIRKNIGILMILSVLLKLTEGHIIVKFEDVNVEYVNGEYIDEDTFDFSVNYINDTYNTLSFRAVVIKDFPPNLTVTSRAHAYALGAFRVPMGLDIEVSTCDLSTQSIFIAPFILAIGGDLNRCAPEKGEYVNESFFPVNVDMVPNFFPKNKYKTDVKVGNKDIDIIKFQIYNDIL